MTTDELGGPRLPTGEEEDRLWSLLAQAWSKAGDSREAFVKVLTELCEGMSSEELTDLDRVVERKLYDVDRADIHAVTDGSDDGFLYARGLIVASGREKYYAVLADPNAATPDDELEEMCYFFAHLHHEKYGSWPETGSGISRESCSNPEGWRSA
ncbi:hypothetical protein Caci_7195 [Catenulispora acidiphila DSM 44928]|uniref:DUF4240 domain-containing protein n=1 Tax=Catenulispora acidiphila (strain DSM 44928 / JCM 14897 / NBRC 102108 / NRRL B-24433 / ID139908) TaxID=479433 RepID=C7Q711_CATAD|nr:DUF4240 domain-containing protein [Catenulispora acidiphila]ACU76024.1 hypothetical protein Caci_7195 [Catenulispora acidiphila DSM 44928]